MSLQSEPVIRVLASRFTVVEMFDEMVAAARKAHDAARLPRSEETLRVKHFNEHLVDTYAWAIAERIVKE